MRDFTSNIDDDAIMNMRADRNRPDMDPGMEDDDDGWESLGGSDDMEDSWGGSFNRDDDFSFDSPMMGGMGGMRPMGGMEGSMGRPMGGMGSRFGNNSGFSSQYGSPMGQQQQNNQNQNMEDKFWNAVITGGKGGLNFITAFFESFKNFNLHRKKTFGYTLLLSSFAVLCVSLLLIVMLDPYFFNFAIAGALGSALGAVVFMTSMHNLGKAGNKPSNVEMPENEWEDENSGFSYPDDDDDDDFKNIDTDEDDEKDNRFPSSVLEHLERNSNLVNPFESDTSDRDTIELSTRSKEDLIQELEKNIKENRVDTRMLTKQYLYDVMLSTLETRTPNYSVETELDEDSREFLAFCDMVKSAAEVVGSSKNQDNAPEVLSVTDKLFYTLITLRRPKWLNEGNINKLVKEIVNVCALNKKTHEVDESITGWGTVAGNEAYIKIYKGETAMVTVKDIYLSDIARKEILKGKMKMPLAFGIDAEGEELLRDFKDIHSLLVAGAPRSGKSWFVKTLMAQLMMFKKPSEFEFYVIDAKTLTSDYFHLVTPHIRQFLSKDEEIIALLRHLCNDEAERRERLFYEKGGVQNIEDFHKKNPFDKMPYILVVMDEVITISNRMDKEMKQEFMGLLKTLTSRLPSLGIRILMVPHVIKNQVLDKTITDMIPYRISVKGDPEAVEAITGATPKQFPTRLNHMGDIAFKLDNSGVCFAHTPIVSDTNEGFDEFFAFLTDFWLHIEPESVRGSKLEKDILNGLKNPDDYSALSSEYISEIKDKKNKMMELRNASRPQRPQKPQSKPIKDSDSEDEDNDDNDDRLNQARPKVSSKSSGGKVVNRPQKPNSKSSKFLTDSETDELLKDVHKKSNITFDDSLM